jgi:hypothetical protein
MYITLRFEVIYIVGKLAGMRVLGVVDFTLDYPLPYTSIPNKSTPNNQPVSLITNQYP